MTRRILIVLTLLAALGLVATGASSATQKNGKRGTMCALHAKLTPQAELHQSTSKAHGFTVVKIRHDGTTRFLTVIVNPKRENFWGGHIHIGDASSTGGIALTLFGLPDRAQDGTTDRRVIVQHGRRSMDYKQAKEICSNPSGFYINYHTDSDQAGAVRGQLR